MGVVRGTDSGERCGCACLVNTNVNDLALRGLGVGQHELVVNGHVVLAVGVVHSLAEGRMLPYRRYVPHRGGDGSDTVTEALHFYEVLHQADEGHGDCGGLLPEPFLAAAWCLSVGQGSPGWTFGRPGT